jgi:hypothetical protein
MYKKLFFLILSGLSVFSCQNKKNDSERTGNDETIFTETEIIPEEEIIDYKKILEKFCGYYFYVDKWSTAENVIIVEVSFNEQLNLNIFLYMDEEIKEVEKIILDDTSTAPQNNDKFIYFKNSALVENDIAKGAEVTVTYSVDHESLFISFADNGAPWVSGVFINSSRNFFVTDYDKIKDAIHACFSHDAQKKYTGNFVFKEYTPDSEYAENPINNEKEEMVVNIREDGRLEITHIRGDKTIFHCVFLIRDKNKEIWSSEGGLSYGDGYDFLDENTIIYRYQNGLAEDRLNRYTITYVKTNEF